MKKYTININYDWEVEANNEEEARQIFWDEMTRNNETPQSVLAELITIEPKKR